MCSRKNDTKARFWRAFVVFCNMQTASGLGAFFYVKFVKIFHRFFKIMLQNGEICVILILTAYNVRKKHF